MQFDFNGYHVLEDERVWLRPLQHADIGHLMPFSLNEPELWNYFTTTWAGKDNLFRQIRAVVKGREAQEQYPFVVFDKKKNAYAGCTRFYEINFEYQSLMIGHTFYGKDFQGTGLNLHVKYLMLQFAFESMDMQRVEFRADSNNARSLTAMQSIGCTVEGILRQDKPTHIGGRRSSVVLSIMRAEWEEDVKKRLELKMKNENK